MAKWTVALNKKGEKVNIGDAERRETYTCINCGERMVPRRGEQNTWHFAHQTITEQCDHDGWLHKEILFLLTSKLERKDTLTVDYDGSHINLTDNILFKREKEYNGIFPDILIQTDDNIYLLEVCVTNRCSKEKIELGYKIIEIFTENAQILDELASGHIHSKGKHYTLAFHNFTESTTACKIQEQPTNIPEIISPESERQSGASNVSHQIKPQKTETLSTTNEGTAQKPKHIYNFQKNNIKHESFFVLHSDRTFEIKYTNEYDESDLLVLQINTVHDFALNIGKSIAWKKGLIHSDSLTEYERHIDIQAVIIAFNITEIK